MPTTNSRNENCNCYEYSLLCCEHVSKYIFLENSGQYKNIDKKNDKKRLKKYMRSGHVENKN